MKLADLTPEFILQRSCPEPNTGCWLWERTLNTDGYGMIYPNRSTLGAHRASWIAHNGPIAPGLCVCHRCDTPACVNPAHLFLGTQRDNMRDCQAKGRFVVLRGESSPRAKLTAEAVLAIRAACGAGVSRRAAAERFGVDESTIYKIAFGLRWKHLTQASAPGGQA